MALGRTIIVLRSLMAVLAPLTGARASGKARVRSTTGGEVILPRNVHAAPIIASETGNSQIARDKLLITTEQTTINPQGTAVPLASLLGGKRHNFSAATKLRWDPELVGVESVSELVEPTVGGEDATGDAHIKRILAYEELATVELARSLFEAQSLSLAPTVILAWAGSGPQTRRGRNVWTRPDQWIAYVVVTRSSSTIERGHEGLNLLDLVEAYLGERGAVDGLNFSDPPIAITGRRRHQVTPTSYVYALSLETGGAVERVDTRVDEGRVAKPWKSTAVEVPLAATATTPERPLVGRIEFAQPQE